MANITKEYVTQQIIETVNIIKKLRESKGFKAGETDDSMPVAMLIDPTGGGRIIATAFDPNNSTWEQVMQAVAKMADDIQALALLLIEDARILDPEAMARYFGLAKLPLEERRQRCRELLDDLFGGTIANLPQELWSHILIVTIEGPLVGKSKIGLPYAKGPDDSVAWLQGEPSDGVNLQYIQ